MSLFKKMIGISPTKEAAGEGFIPSPLGRLLGVAKISDYAPYDFGRMYSGDKRVLVLCTEERYLKMNNGTKFSTGHNVQETAVPLMHLTGAGFDFDVITPTGQPAILEDWSVPGKDKAVIAFIETNRAKFDKPLSLAWMVKEGLSEELPYETLFIPGGHGAMVGLPEDPNVGALLRWIHATERFFLSVCHGPAALVAATLGGHKQPYAGYSMCAFPDKIDRQSPSIGYLPGPMPWFQCEKLEEQGLHIVNDGADGATHVDRKLYSGDSPKACDELGRLIAKAMLNATSTEKPLDHIT